LWLLARRFGTTVDAIKQLNGLTSDSLRIGQVLKIPSASSGGSGGSGGGSTGYFNHTVTSGETLWILAQRYGTTVDAIKQLNGLTSDALSIGQVLKIPSASSGGNGGGSTGYFNHTVTSGETLWILANRYGTTVDAIKQLNGLTSDALSIGQVLKIPQKATSASVNSGVSAVSVPKKEIELEVVEVKPESKTKPAVIQAFDITTGIASPTGDTEIISSYNPDAIADIQLSNAEAVIPPNSDNVFAANTDISSYAPQTSIDTPVYINQSNETLGTKVVETCQCQEEEIVPDDTINECGNVVHTVVKGETLWSLAHKYGTSSKEIMCLNCLSCPTLCVGQVIEIPANPAFANFDKCGKPCPKASSQVIYSVKAGDSLWNIARKYNTTVEAIMKYNFLSSDVLTLGQRMYIPISVKPDVSESSRLYIVKAGDSLWTIAQKFGTTVESIYKKNNLSTDVLQIGKVLEI
jgi:LysM repeat protein